MLTFALTLVRDTADLVESMRADIPSVLVVDNGSHDCVQDSWLRIPCNRYFSGGWNRAMEKLYQDHQGEECWAWLLNSDVSGASISMLEDLVRIAKKHNAVIASPAVPTSVWPDMKVDGIQEAPFVDFVAPVVNVQWFIQSGGLDEQLPGWGSDLDLCFRTQRYTKIVAGHQRIHHPYGTTSKRLGDRTMYQIDMTRRYLMSKHGEKFRTFAPSYIGNFRW